MNIFKIFFLFIIFARIGTPIKIVYNFVIIISYKDIKYQNYALRK